MAFAAAYVLYNVARFVFASDLDEATDNAGWIIDLERATGTAIEGSLQRAFDAATIAWALSNVYLIAQLVVLPLTLIWLYRRSPPIYRVLRNTVVATWMLAVPVFALFPVAPPRLAGLGLADTVGEEGIVALTGRSTLFYNQFAAVPSLHVGFAFAVGIAVAATLLTWRGKLLAGLWAPLVTLAVVVTANHYVFDVAAGLLVTAAGFCVGRAVELRRAVARSPLMARTTG